MQEHFIDENSLWILLFTHYFTLELET